MNNYECVGCGCEFDGSPVAGTGCTHEGRRYGACEECVEEQPEAYQTDQLRVPRLRKQITEALANHEGLEE